MKTGKAWSAGLAIAAFIAWAPAAADDLPLDPEPDPFGYAGRTLIASPESRTGGGVAVDYTDPTTGVVLVREFTANPVYSSDEQPIRIITYYDIAGNEIGRKTITPSAFTDSVQISWTTPTPDGRVTVTRMDHDGDGIADTASRRTTVLDADGRPVEFTLEEDRGGDGSTDIVRRETVTRDEAGRVTGISVAHDGNADGVEETTVARSYAPPQASDAHSIGPTDTRNLPQEELSTLARETITIDADGDGTPERTIITHDPAQGVTAGPTIGSEPSMPIGDTGVENRPYSFHRNVDSVVLTDADENGAPERRETLAVTDIPGSPNDRAYRVAQADLDTDGDGTFDRREQYEYDREATFVRIDTEADGIAEELHIDRGGDGSVDIVRRDTDGDGWHDVEVIDTDGDGRDDTWIHAGNEADYARPQRIERDTDGDGRIDTVETIEYGTSGGQFGRPVRHTVVYNPAGGDAPPRSTEITEFRLAPDGALVSTVVTRSEDRDGDGRAEWTAEREAPGNGASFRDVDGDGRFEWVSLTLGDPPSPEAEIVTYENTQGNSVRRAVVRFDGPAPRVDYAEWSGDIDNDGRQDRLERDTDGDGRYETVVTTSYDAAGNPAERTTTVDRTVGDGVFDSVETTTFRHETQPDGTTRLVSSETATTVAEPPSFAQTHEDFDPATGLLSQRRVLSDTDGDGRIDTETTTQYVAVERGGPSQVGVQRFTPVETVAAPQFTFVRHDDDGDGAYERIEWAFDPYSFEEYTNLRGEFLDTDGDGVVDRSTFVLGAATNVAGPPASITVVLGADGRWQAESGEANWPQLNRALANLGPDGPLAVQRGRVVPGPNGTDRVDFVIDLPILGQIAFRAPLDPFTGRLEPLPEGADVPDVAPPAPPAEITGGGSRIDALLGVLQALGIVDTDRDGRPDALDLDGDGTADPPPANRQPPPPLTLSPQTAGAQSGPTFGASALGPTGFGASSLPQPGLDPDSTQAMQNLISNGSVSAIATTTSGGAMSGSFGGVGVGGGLGGR
ncbi:MAG: hypothetical protein AB7N54_09385 [Alphaproteobacteria bacterium]